MSFPINEYDNALAVLRATVADRDAKGRNETNDFYEQFPHGSQDLTFELHRRVQRILGAERLGNSQVVYEDTLDLANYAIFLMMRLNKDRAAQSPVSELEAHTPDRFDRWSQSTVLRHLAPKVGSTAS
jgi:hypothetical protein